MSCNRADWFTNVTVKSDAKCWTIVKSKTNEKFYYKHLACIHEQYQFTNVSALDADTAGKVSGIRYEQWEFVLHY